MADPSHIPPTHLLLGALPRAHTKVSHRGRCQGGSVGARRQGAPPDREASLRIESLTRVSQCPPRVSVTWCVTWSLPEKPSTGAALTLRQWPRTDVCLVREITYISLTESEAIIPPKRDNSGLIIASASSQSTCMHT